MTDRCLTGSQVAFHTQRVIRNPIGEQVAGPTLLRTAVSDEGCYSWLCLFSVFSRAIKSLSLGTIRSRLSIGNKRSRISYHTSSARHSIPRLMRSRTPTNWKDTLLPSSFLYANSPRLPRRFAKRKVSLGERAS